MESARAGARGKRTRPEVARFLLDLEPEVCRIQRELQDGSYQPGRYHTFWIADPKPRQISAAPFRDRVLHHALTRALEPVFERRFIANSYASRKGFGQHRALEQARAAFERYPYVLKCDIRKYFPSVDHAILKELLERCVKCRPTLDLAERIIDGSNPQEECAAYFPGDNLFTPFERRRGAADRQSDLTVFRQRLPESARSLRGAGVAPRAVPALCGRFRFVRWR